MDTELVSSLVKDLGFPIVISLGLLVYVVRTSRERETRMWETIQGFQSVLTKFDGTLKDISFGLKEVREDVTDLKADVADIKLKANRKGE